MNRWKFVLLMSLTSMLVFSTACSRSRATKDAGESKETEQQGNGADTDAETDVPEQVDPENAEKIGILLPSEQWDARWRIDAAGMQIKLDDYGFLPLIQYAENDADLQKQQFRELLEQDVSALVIAPVDAYSLGDELAAADEKSVPVFSYDTLIMDTGDLDYYMAFNARSVGNQAGEKILAAMGISQESTAPVVRPLKMEMLMGAPDSIQSLFFYNGLMEVLEPAIEKGVLSIPSGLMSFDETAVMDSDKKSAADRFEKIRTEFYKGGVPDILITADEDYAIEILKDLREEEKLPYITTAGRKLETIKKIASGSIGSAVFLDNRILSQKCAETVHTLLKGSEDPEISDYEMYDNGVKIVSTIFVDTEVIDQDNYEMLADNGYFTEAELRIQLSPTPEPGASGTPAPTITPTPAPSSGTADSDTPREKTAKADPTPTQKPED